MEKKVKRSVKLRTEQARLFWNNNIDEIVMSIVHSHNKLDAHFKWSQLVWQEIMMFISLDKDVTDEDLHWICRRRGFTRRQKDFLKRALCHVGLRKKNENGHCSGHGDGRSR